MLAGYFLLVRSAAVNSFNPEDYIPSEQKKDTSIDSPIEEEVSSKQKDPKKLEEKK